jgi:DNA-binding winged helix-turn-helix (wHTH) protein
MSADLRLTPIDLAHEPPFTLGGLSVTPANLQVAAGERRETLEPRIMQVLVALARQRGEVVSRDDLIASCWAGRVVGEDAINRCIFRLRRLADELGGFALETVPRVGYRLSETGAAPQAARRRRRWPWVAAGAAALLLLAAAGGGVWFLRRSVTVEAEPAPRVAVTGFKAISDEPAARALAADLGDSAAGVLGEHALAVGQPAAAADMTLSGSVVRENGVWRVREHLDDVKSGFMLWSQDFDWPVGQEGPLRDQVTVAGVDAVFYAMEPLKQPGLKVDPRTMALFVRACRLAAGPGHAPEAVRLLEETVSRSPRFAAAYGLLSLERGLILRGAPPAEAQRLRRQMQREADLALQSDPRVGSDAYDARYNLARYEHPSAIVAAEDGLIKGMAANPENPWLQMRECRLLIELGRGLDAHRYCERARALRPLDPPIDWANAQSLHQAGDYERAASAAAESARYHPEHIGSRAQGFEIAAFEGSPDAALAMIPVLEREPPVAPPDTIAAMSLYLRARQTHDAGDADRAMTALRAAARRIHDGRWLIMSAAALGRTDDAFAALDEFGVQPDRTVIGLVMGLLLEPALAPLRSDPRFWRDAAEAGYLAHWRARNAWPDFCNGPRPQLDCKALAAQAGV